jgi:3-isopropylmalate/(R)-2-methylmalate dehydratase small subunit
MRCTGRVWKYGDNVDTDVLYPGQYLVYFDPEEVGKHALEGLDPEFSSKIAWGDILVAGVNFGCGSAREQAARTLKYAGISLVIADSFCRTFYRNAIAIGLNVIEYPEATTVFNEGDCLAAEVDKGTIKNLTTGLKVQTVVMPELLLTMMKGGGALNYYKLKIK